MHQSWTLINRAKRCLHQGKLNLLVCRVVLQLAQLLKWVCLTPSGVCIKAVADSVLDQNSSRSRHLEHCEGNMKASLICVLAVIAIVAEAADSTPPQSSLTSEQKNLITDLHNDFRRNVAGGAMDMLKLVCC